MVTGNSRQTAHPSLRAVPSNVCPYMSCCCVLPTNCPCSTTLVLNLSGTELRAEQQVVDPKGLSPTQTWQRAGRPGPCCRPCPHHCPQRPGRGGCRWGFSWRPPRKPGSHGSSSVPSQGLLAAPLRSLARWRYLPEPGGYQLGSAQLSWNRTPHPHWYTHLHRGSCSAPNANPVDRTTHLYNLHAWEEAGKSQSEHREATRRVL